MPAVAPDDLDFITQALGQAPVGLLGVAARRPDGQPAVITTYPLREHAGRMVPFPTFYWLVCPDLQHTLSDLERQGTIKAIEARLQEDADLLAAYHNDHRRYIAQRLEALPPIDRIRAHELKTLGIAGIADWSRVKCLHAHTAHHLADPDGNTVAKLLIAEHSLTL